VAVLLLVVLPAVLAKVGEAGTGKRVPKQVHTKGEYRQYTPSARPLTVVSRKKSRIITAISSLQRLFCRHETLCRIDSSFFTQKYFTNNINATKNFYFLPKTLRV
jgi:hypothetical protein